MGSTLATPLASSFPTLVPVLGSSGGCLGFLAFRRLPFEFLTLTFFYVTFVLVVTMFATVPTGEVGRYVISALGLPPRGVLPRGFCSPTHALLHVPPQSGFPTWGKGAVAARSTLLRVLPRGVTHVRPKSHIPLLRADDTWGSVPSHVLVNLRILGSRGTEPGQRPCPAGTRTWVGFQ